MAAERAIGLEPLLERGQPELLEASNLRPCEWQSRKVTERTVEAHVKAVFGKLGLGADPGSNRRVLATLTYLRTVAP